MDALAYSSIESNLDPTNTADKDVLNRLSAGYRTKHFPNISVNSYTNINNELTKVLNNTTIKRACCRKNSTDGGLTYTTDVKILIPKELNSEEIDLDFYNTFKYFAKQITIPVSYCDTYASDNKITFTGPTYGSDGTQNNSPTYCDFFYDTYCANTSKIFADLVGTTSWDYEEFKQFSPDCGCYQPAPPALANFVATGIDPTCFLSIYGCGTDEVTSNSAYMPSAQRKRDCTTGTICYNSINYSDSSISTLIGNYTQSINSCGTAATTAATTATTKSATAATTAASTTAATTAKSATAATTAASTTAATTAKSATAATTAASTTASTTATTTAPTTAATTVAPTATTTAATTAATTATTTAATTAASTTAKSTTAATTAPVSGSGSSSDSTDWGMIIGLIGGGIVLLIIIIIVIYMKKK
jgi:hypothetical protein